MTVSLKLIDISGPFPTSLYHIFSDDSCIGKCELRHRPGKSAHLPEGFESHIYYEIDAPYRGQGYAKNALRELLIGARHLGLDEVILVVAEDNIPSQRVIEANQAELLGATLGADGLNYRKYRILLQREKRKIL